jgi:hypothetical protein
MTAIAQIMRGIVLTLIALLLSVPALAADVGKGAALLKAIKAQKLDETIGVLNEIKQAQHRGDVLPLLLDLWRNDQQKHTDVPWNFVNLDAVRINIADILVQAYRNGQAEIDRPSVHAFAKKVATASGDVQARANALVVLGIIDDPRDVNTLRAAAAEEKDFLSTSALVSLGMMCNRDAGDALDGLTGALKAKQFVERAKDAQQLHAQMVKSKSGWCARRPFVVAGAR